MITSLVLVFFSLSFYSFPCRCGFRARLYRDNATTAQNPINHTSERKVHANEQIKCQFIGFHLSIIWIAWHDCGNVTNNLINSIVKPILRFVRDRFFYRNFSQRIWEFFPSSNSFYWSDCDCCHFPRFHLMNFDETEQRIDSCGSIRSNWNLSAQLKSHFERNAEAEPINIHFPLVRLLNYQMHNYIYIFCECLKKKCRMKIGCVFEGARSHINKHNKN